MFDNRSTGRGSDAERGDRPPALTRWQRAFDYWEKQKTLYNSTIPITLITQIADIVVHSFKMPFVHYSVVHLGAMLDLIQELNSAVYDDFRHKASVSISLISQIRDLLANSFRFPFTQLSLVNEDNLLDLLEELEVTFSKECGVRWSMYDDSGQSVLRVSTHGVDQDFEEALNEPLSVDEIEQLRTLISDISENISRIEFHSSSTISKIDEFERNIGR